MATDWVIPADRLLRIRYGRVKTFTVTGRCVAQDETGVFVVVEPETDPYSELAPVRQFIPYASLIEVSVVSVTGKTQVEVEEEEDTRRRRVHDELATLLGGGEAPTQDDDFGPGPGAEDRNGGQLPDGEGTG